jgi:hypothetical protein
LGLQLKAKVTLERFALKIGKGNSMEFDLREKMSRLVRNDHIGF